jgi:pseudaminic acid cytidylyltransferase
MSKSLCIIPARGGSKRIPKKNIKDFNGKPIIVYSIETALNSCLFDEVMVSTDDNDIAKIAVDRGAKVPFFRSEQNSSDYATIMDVVQEVLACYKNQGEVYESVCLIYPTAPFVNIEMLKLGYEKLKNVEAVLPVTDFSYPVWRSFNVKSGFLSYQWPEFELSRSQDLEKLYHDAGQWFWIKPTAIKNRSFPKLVAPVMLSNLEVQDIDSLEDWELAEIKYKLLQKKING